MCTYAKFLLVAYEWLTLRLGLRSGEVTPSPPSRPLSALSQQSMNSVNSGVSLRARPVAASRKPRPISIAVTGVTQESDSQTVRASHRHSEPLSLLFTLLTGHGSYERAVNYTSDIFTFLCMLFFVVHMFMSARIVRSVKRQTAGEQDIFIFSVASIAAMDPTQPSIFFLG